MAEVRAEELPAWVHGDGWRRRRPQRLGSGEASAWPGQAARIGSTGSREGSRMVGRTGEGRGR
jgi:hypothetical protein